MGQVELVHADRHNETTKHSPTNRATVLPLHCHQPITHLVQIKAIRTISSSPRVDTHYNRAVLRDRINRSLHGARREHPITSQQHACRWWWQQQGLRGIEFRLNGRNIRPQNLCRFQFQGHACCSTFRRHGWCGAASAAVTATVQEEQRATPALGQHISTIQRSVTQMRYLGRYFTPSQLRRKLLRRIHHLHTLLFGTAA